MRKTIDVGLDYDVITYQRRSNMDFFSYVCVGTVIITGLTVAVLHPHLMTYLDTIIY